MRTQLVLVLSISAVLVLAGCATHRPRPRGHQGFRPGARMLLRYDLNHDGQVTRGELEKGLRAAFDKADTNHDGRLDKAEVRAVNEARWAKYKSESSPLVDWNHDGYVSFSEFAAGPRSLFDQLDANNDGVVSRAELRGPGAGPPRRIHKSRKARAGPPGAGDGDGDSD